MIPRKLLLVLLLCGAFFYTVPGFAAESSASNAAGSPVDARAMLMRMGEFLAQAKQFSVNVQSGYDSLQETGQKIEFQESRKITLVRPDRIRVDVDRSDGDKGLVLFDGQEITVFSPKDKLFAKASKPGDVDNAIRYLLAELGVRMPLAMMFTTNLPAELERRVQSVEFVEENRNMAVQCVHLAARAEGVDFQVWIPSTGDPLPRRVIITYKDAPGQPQFWANLEWNLSPDTPEGFFAFTPAEGVNRIPFLAELKESRSNAQKVKKGGKQ